MGNYNSGSKFPLKIRTQKQFGCTVDIPDQRDQWTSFPKLIEYYESVDLRKTEMFPCIRDQGHLGSSVAFALIAAYVFSLRKEGIAVETNYSPQFVYFNQRLLTGTTEADSGGSIRDAIKVIERLGICKEEMYPYTTGFFRDRPTEESYKYAYSNKYPIQYRRLKLTLEDIMKSISIKYPVIMGFTVYESFLHPDVARTGVMPVPKLGEKIISHHSTLIIGYDSVKKYFLCRNSWGESWGQKGHFWIPFQFINSRNCSDLWIISSSTGSIKNELKSKESKESNESKTSTDEVTGLREIIIHKEDPLEFKDDISEPESEPESELNA